MRFDEVKQPAIDMLRAPAATTRSGLPWGARLMAMPYVARRLPPPQTPSRSLRGVALLRILVGTVVLGAADVWRAPLLMDDAPVGQLLRAVVVVAAAMSTLGLLTRAATTVMAVALAALFGLIQQQGTPIHVHHVVWLAVLVAVSPAGSAWSMDARRRPTTWEAGTGNASEDAAEAILRWACVVLALVYFFPGIHKIVDAGSPFTDGESLARLVRLKAIEAGVAVPFELDRRPVLLLVGGMATVFGELAVIVAALVRPRAGVVIVALIHLAIVVALHMPYTVLAVFALAFALPSSRGLPFRLFRRAPRVSAVASALVVGICWAGAREDLTGYPFSCYPTFSLPVPESVRVLDIAVFDDAGALVLLPHTVVVPDDMRTPVTFASRQVITAAAAERFVAWRRRDPRFQAALAGMRRVRVIVVVRDLSSAHAPDVPVLVTDVELLPASPEP